MPSKFPRAQGLFLVALQSLDRVAQLEADTDGQEARSMARETIRELSAELRKRSAKPSKNRFATGKKSRGKPKLPKRKGKKIQQGKTKSSGTPRSESIYLVGIGQSLKAGSHRNQA